MSERSRLRLVVLQVLVLSLMVTLLGRLAFLQVVSGEQYQRAAADNRIREVVTPAVRGQILDAQGRSLVRNRTTLVVSVDRTVLAAQKDNGEAVIGRLSKALDVTPASIDDALKLCGTEGAKKPPICWNGSPYQPIPIAKDVKTDVALSILERQEDFPGVSAELEAVREYPSPGGVNAAHLLGYLGPISDEELKNNAASDDQPFQRADLIGRAGLEAQYDAQLRGVPGVKSLAVNNNGVVTGTVATTEAQPGNYLVTSIDAKVQAVTEKALKDRIDAARAGEPFGCENGCAADSGAAVVMDVTNGQVIAMASYPTYDPRVWVGGVSTKEYEALVDPKANTPLLSRAVAGEFAPASTFKVVSTAAAARGGDSLNASYPCQSEIQIGNRTLRNFESQGFGNISVKRALEVSCNTVFYQLGYDAWVRDGGLRPGDQPSEWFVQTARDFGYGSATGIDLPGERSGRIVSRQDRRDQWEAQKDQWCKRGDEGYPEVSDATRAAYLKAIARENCVDGWQYRGGDAANFAIGQGDTLATPLQVARTYAAIANGGTLWTPSVAKAVIAPDGTVVEEFEPKKSGELPIDDATLSYLQDSLQGVGENGTGAGLFGSYPVRISAKTGSGQVTGKGDTSWFASYGPSNDARYAVVMMISQGGTGSGTSGPGVKAIYDTLMGVNGGSLDPSASAFPQGEPPSSLPTVRPDGTVKFGASSSGGSAGRVPEVRDSEAATVPSPSVRVPRRGRSRQALPSEPLAERVSGRRGAGQR